MEESHATSQSELSGGEEKAPHHQKDKKKGKRRGSPHEHFHKTKEEVLSDLLQLPYGDVSWVLSHFPLLRPSAGPYGLATEIPLTAPSVPAMATPSQVHERTGRSDLPARTAAAPRRTQKAKERKLRKQLKDLGSGASSSVREGLEKKITAAREKREKLKAKAGLRSPSPSEFSVSSSSSSSQSSSSSPQPTPPLTPLLNPTLDSSSELSSRPPPPPPLTLRPSAIQQKDEEKKGEGGSTKSSSGETRAEKRDKKGGR